MKNLCETFCKLLSLILLLTLVSCQQQDDTCYSCNEETDQWAKSHVGEILNMSRVEIADLPDAKMRAAYRVLPAERRQQFWLEKLSQVSKQLEGEEKTHFAEFQKLVQQIDFAQDIPPSALKFVNSHFAYGKTHFGWTDQFGYAAFFHWSDLEVGTTVQMRKRAELFEGKECHCRWSLGCTGSGDSCETDIECGEKDGCGWFLLEKCTGRCSDYL